MHRSRLSGLIIDCQTDDLDAAAKFLGKALGAPPKEKADLDSSPYVTLETAAGEPYLEVQKVDHESRIHLDIEADDIDGIIDEP